MKWKGKLTYDSLISPWVIDIIISCWNWILQMLSDSIHSSIAFLSKIILLLLNALWLIISFILWHLHTLFLQPIHHTYCVILFILQHLLQMLLFSNWTQRNIRINWIVVFLLVSKHFDFSFFSFYLFLVNS